MLCLGRICSESSWLPSAFILSPLARTCHMSVLWVFKVLSGPFKRVLCFFLQAAKHFRMGNTPMLLWDHSPAFVWAQLCSAMPCSPCSCCCCCSVCAWMSSAGACWITRGPCRAKCWCESRLPCWAVPAVTGEDSSFMVLPVTPWSKKKLFLSLSLCDFTLQAWSCGRDAHSWQLQWCQRVPPKEPWWQQSSGGLWL